MDYFLFPLRRAVLGSAHPSQADGIDIHTTARDAVHHVLYPVPATPVAFPLPSPTVCLGPHANVSRVIIIPRHARLAPTLSSLVSSSFPIRCYEPPNRAVSVPVRPSAYSLTGSWSRLRVVFYREPGPLCNRRTWMRLWGTRDVISCIPRQWARYLLRIQ